MTSRQEQFEVLYKLHSSMGALDYALAVFGFDLAKREGYKDLDGLEAIHFYLVHKFKWTPAQVRGMSLEDIRFVLTEEMNGWHMPVEANRAIAAIQRSGAG